MSVARQAFLDRLAALRKSVSIEAVTDKASPEHNEIARMLRNGLAVVGFAALEDYIKKRSGEVLSLIGTTGVSFSALPEKIRYATTVDAIDSLKYQLSLIKNKPDALLYAQTHAHKISSTINPTYDLATEALGYNKANVSEEDVKNILSCFNIKDPWGNMSNISSTLGITALSLNESYKNAFLRRHKAAHAPHSNTPQLDIEQYVKEAAGIAISFDCLLSKALHFISAQDRDYLSGAKCPNSSHIKFRTIRPIGGMWKEFAPMRNTATKTEGSVDILVPQAANRAIRNGETLALFDQYGNLSYWECY